MYVLVLYVWHRGIKSATCQRFIANLIVPTIVDIGKVFLISLRAAPYYGVHVKHAKHQSVHESVGINDASQWNCY